MTDDEDDSTDENLTNCIHDHHNYMTARENMQEFPGRVPQRKRKREAENPQQESKPKVRREKFFFFLFHSPLEACKESQSSPK